MNTFGTRLRLTTFGESHGKAMGGVIDGFPPGFKIDFDRLQKEINKRRPGLSPLTSGRCEEDFPEFLSGISENGISLGTPIGFIIKNKDARPDDYREKALRPNHADYTYLKKYGYPQLSGGGRASARETVNWVTAGAIVIQWLESLGIKIFTTLSAAGKVDESNIFKPYVKGYQEADKFKEEADEKLLNEIKEAKISGESIGGKVSCLILGLQPGVGEPVFSKLHSRLAAAMMSINAAKGFEYGAGFESTTMTGAQSSDFFYIDEGLDNDFKTITNYSGGVQGGISNGMPVFFTVAFKPTPTYLHPIKTIDIERNKVTIPPKGRHDPCVAMRAVPVVKAMTALTIADFLV